MSELFALSFATREKEMTALVSTKLTCRIYYLKAYFSVRQMPTFALGLPETQYQVNCIPKYIATSCYQMMSNFCHVWQ